jgi:hypothetical protein
MSPSTSGLNHRKTNNKQHVSLKRLLTFNPVPGTFSNRILSNHRYKNLKSYKVEFLLALFFDSEDGRGMFHRSDIFQLTTQHYSPENSSSSVCFTPLSRLVESRLFLWQPIGCHLLDTF